MLKRGFSFKAEAGWILFFSLVVPIVGLVIYLIAWLVR
jgi:hypothetical protein